MAFPTGSVSELNLNDATDSPASARTDLLLAVQKLNSIISSYDAADGIAALDSSGLIVNTKLPDALQSSSGNNITMNPNTGVVKVNNLIELTPRTVAQLNALTGVEGQVAYVSNDTGGKALAVYDGSAWKKLTLGGPIST